MLTVQAVSNWPRMRAAPGPLLCPDRMLRSRLGLRTKWVYDDLHGPESPGIKKDDGSP
jgi:hypothetical protein